MPTHTPTGTLTDEEIGRVFDLLRLTVNGNPPLPAPATPQTSYVPVTIIRSNSSQPVQLPNGMYA